MLINLIKYCEYYGLTEKQSLDLINSKLFKPLSRSTYYNHKKKLYQDEKFQSLKKSIYKSKMLKSLLLYIDDENTNEDDSKISKYISDKFPDNKSVFQITSDQFDKESRLCNKIKSNFCIASQSDGMNKSNLVRVNELPNNYTLREEYVRCGKDKFNKCKSCPHGPYYYAYWREKSSTKNKSILKKKYLGTIDPKL
jgi:hypothetical protein